MSLFVPCPKSSTITLTLCLIPPLVHAPQSICLLSSWREIHTVSIWHLRLFWGLPQPWTNLMIDLASPDMNPENTVPTNGLPTNYHTYTFLYYHLCFHPAPFSFDTKPQCHHLQLLSSNQDCPSERSVLIVLAIQSAFLPCSVTHCSTLTQSHIYNHHCTPPAPSFSSTPTFLDYFSSSSLNPRGMCSPVLQWPLSDLIKALSCSHWLFWALFITHSTGALQHSRAPHSHLCVLSWGMCYYLGD